MPRVLDATAQKLLDLLEPHTDTDKHLLMKNLSQITEWEKTSNENNIIRYDFSALRLEK